jgi:hypothetical protein
MEKPTAFRTIMNAPDRDHPDEDALERFLLNQSEEQELEIIETHILACEACVTRLETLELNIAATKLAIKTMQAEQAAKLAKAAHGGFWKNWVTVPRLAGAGAAMAACALTLTVASLPNEVTLTAYRGSETVAVKEWRPLKMHLNARDLPPGPVGIEVVNNQGDRIWQGQSIVKEENIDVNVPRLTKAGNYYLRVYSVASKDAAAELEREFALQAKPLF